MANYWVCVHIKFFFFFPSKFWSVLLVNLICQEGEWGTTCQYSTIGMESCWLLLAVIVIVQLKVSALLFHCNDPQERKARHDSDNKGKRGSVIESKAFSDWKDTVYICCVHLCGTFWVSSDTLNLAHLSLCPRSLEVYHSDKLRWSDPIEKGWESINWLGLQVNVRCFHSVQSSDLHSSLPPHSLCRSTKAHSFDCSWQHIKKGFYSPQQSLLYCTEQAHCWADNYSHRWIHKVSSLMSYFCEWKILCSPSGTFCWSEHLDSWVNWWDFSRHKTED